MAIIRVVAGALGILLGVSLIVYALGWVARGLAQLAVGAALMVTGGALCIVGVAYVIDEAEQSKELSRALKSTRQRVDRLQRRTGRIWR